MLQQTRKIKGLTQQQLADAVGVARASIAQYENGFSNPPISTAIAIAGALGTTVEALFGELTTATATPGAEEAQDV